MNPELSARQLQKLIEVARDRGIDDLNEAFMQVFLEGLAERFPVRATAKVYPFPPSTTVFVSFF